MDKPTGAKKEFGSAQKTAPKVYREENQLEEMKILAAKQIEDFNKWRTSPFFAELAKIIAHSNARTMKDLCSQSNMEITQFNRGKIDAKEGVLDVLNHIYHLNDK